MAACAATPKDENGYFLSRSVPSTSQCCPSSSQPVRHTSLSGYSSRWCTTSKACCGSPR